MVIEVGPRCQGYFRVRLWRRKQLQSWEPWWLSLALDSYYCYPQLSLLSQEIVRARPGHQTPSLGAPLGSAQLALLRNHCSKCLAHCQHSAW